MTEKLPLSKNQAALLKNLWELSKIRGTSGLLEAELTHFLIEYYLAGNPAQALVFLKKEGFLTLDNGSDKYRVVHLPPNALAEAIGAEPLALPGKCALLNLSAHYDAGVRSFNYTHLERSSVEPSKKIRSANIVKQPDGEPDEEPTNVGEEDETPEQNGDKTRPGYWHPDKKPKPGNDAGLMLAILGAVVSETLRRQKHLTGAELGGVLKIYAPDPKQAFAFRKWIAELGYWQNGVTEKALEAVYVNEATLKEKQAALALLPRLAPEEIKPPRFPQRNHAPNAPETQVPKAPPKAKLNAAAQNAPEPADVPVAKTKVPPKKTKSEKKPRPTKRSEASTKRARLVFLATHLLCEEKAGGQRLSGSFAEAICRKVFKTKNAWNYHRPRLIADGFYTRDGNNHNTATYAVSKLGREVAKTPGVKPAFTDAEADNRVKTRFTDRQESEVGTGTERPKAKPEPADNSSAAGRNAEADDDNDLEPDGLSRRMVKAIAIHAYLESLIGGALNIILSRQVFDFLWPKEPYATGYRSFMATATPAYFDKTLPDANGGSWSTTEQGRALVKERNVKPPIEPALALEWIERHGMKPRG